MLRIDPLQAARCQESYTVFLQTVKDFDMASLGAMRYQVRYAAPEWS